MNKRGFTLIELLGVIVILLIVATFTFPALNRMLKNVDDEEYERFKQIIANAAEVYVENNDDLAFNDNRETILIAELINNEYLSRDLVDPETDIKAIDENGYVIITKNPDNSYSYDYMLSPVNKPNLLSNMIPIYYDSECNGKQGCWRKADSNNKEKYYEWYDYYNKEWANAVLVKTSAGGEVNSKSRLEYINSDLGTEILESDILAYFVWIPRYENLTTNLASSYAGGTAAKPNAITVNFIKGRSTTTTSSSYKINNAFTFNNTQLEGIWVGKFETSAGDVTGDIVQDVTIKPDYIAWTNALVANQFTSARNMEVYNNQYGFTQNMMATAVTTSGSNYGDIASDDNNLDTHMLKNSEWGAVAYLSQSTYGRCISSTNCPDIVRNNSSGYYTGRSAGSNSGTSIQGSYQYKTTNGLLASTTQNIYGIYDMSGGTDEYVMGNYNTNTITPPTTMTTPATMGFTTTNYPNIKYIDYYYYNGVTCGNNGNCYGHALGETYGWYGDRYLFVDATNSWMMRGGQYDETTTGIFSHATGSTKNNRSFRIALINL